MKTRAEIYGNEATDLLRIVTMYPGLCEHQLLCFHPGKEDTTKALLSHLERQGRIFQTDGGGYFLAGQTPKTDHALVRSIPINSTGSFSLFKNSTRRFIKSWKNSMQNLFRKRKEAGYQLFLKKKGTSSCHYLLPRMKRLSGQLPPYNLIIS